MKPTKIVNNYKKYFLLVCMGGLLLFVSLLVQLLFLFFFFYFNFIIFSFAIITLLFIFSSHTPKVKWEEKKDSTGVFYSGSSSLASDVMFGKRVSHFFSVNNGGMYIYLINFSKYH